MTNIATSLTAYMSQMIWPSVLLVRSQQELRVYKMVASMRKLYTF